MNSKINFLFLACCVVSLVSVSASEEAADTKSGNKTYKCLTVKNQLNVCGNANIAGSLNVGGVNIAPLVALISANSLSYGSVYNTSAITSLANGGFVTFGNSAPSAGGVLPLMNGSASDDTAITVNNAGVYVIQFSVRGTVGLIDTSLLFQITSGSIASPVTVAQFASNTSHLSDLDVLVVNGSVIVSLAAGTVLRLQNISGAAVAIPSINGTATNAEFSVQRIA